MPINKTPLTDRPEAPLPDPMQCAGVAADTPILLRLWNGSLTIKTIQCLAADAEPTAYEVWTGDRWSLVLSAGRCAGTDVGAPCAGSVRVTTLQGCVDVIGLRAPGGAGAGAAIRHGFPEDFPENPELEMSKDDARGAGRLFCGSPGNNRASEILNAPWQVKAWFAEGSRANSAEGFASDSKIGAACVYSLARAMGLKRVSVHDTRGSGAGGEFLVVARDDMEVKEWKARKDKIVSVRELPDTDRRGFYSLETNGGVFCCGIGSIVLKCESAV
jgi:hypothetical protein